MAVSWEVSGSLLRLGTLSSGLTSNQSLTTAEYHYVHTYMSEGRGEGSEVGHNAR